MLQLPAGKTPFLLNAVHLCLPQAPLYLSRQPGKIRNLRFGRGDIVAQLIVSLLCFAAIAKYPPAYPFRIIENSGSLNLFVFLEDVEIVVGTVVKAACTGQ